MQTKRIIGVVGDHRRSSVAHVHSQMVPCAVAQHSVLEGFVIIMPGHVFLLSHEVAINPIDLAHGRISYQAAPMLRM
jgi:hypothetical protein